MTNQTQRQGRFQTLKEKYRALINPVIIATTISLTPFMTSCSMNKYDQFVGTYQGNKISRETCKGDSSQKVWITGQSIQKWVYVTKEIQDNVTYTPELFARDSDGDGEFERIETSFDIKGVDRKEVGRVGRYVVLDKLLGKEDINDIADDAYKRNIPSENSLNNLANQKSLEDAVLSATIKINGF